MKKKRRTEINLEIEEAVMVRPETLITAHCPWCRTQMQMMAPNEAAITARLTARQVYRLIEDGHLHFIEDRMGSLFVCTASLRRLAK